MQVACPLPGEVHGAQGVLKPGVLRGRENPPRTLQLVNAAEPLQPGAVDQVLLRRGPRHAARPTLCDAKVSVDRIARQVDPGILGRQLGHQAIIGMTSSGHPRSSIASRYASTDLTSGARPMPRCTGG